jgi:hypothetical protein
MSTHEVRIATYVAVHRNWLSKRAEQNDLAVIELRRPFNQVIPLLWDVCPISVYGIGVAVVGYPAEEFCGKRDAYMFESRGGTTCNLENNDGLFIYELDTFKG